MTTPDSRQPALRKIARTALANVERVVVRHGADPLKEIMNRLRGELEKFGIRADDQTVLLIRALA